MATSKLTQTDTAQSKISVSKELAGKRVLVTGATGFVGKVIVEKLLRDVPDIGGIYLLIRGSREYADARRRFDHEIANASIFERLKMTDEQAFETLCETKIRCITGDVTETRFGLSDSAFAALAQKIDVVVNSAASVNFREELDRALSINALSLHNIAEFSLAAGRAPVLHISTCYVNGFNQGEMREENVKPVSSLIPLHQDGYYNVDPLIESLQSHIVKLKSRYAGEKLKRKLIDFGIAEANRYGWNDTYTFTKWMGEQLLRKALNGASLTILRPAIVESTLFEPVPGWIEGVKVADAILMAYAREKVTFFPGNAQGIIDIIPADLVANSVILGMAEQLHDPARHRVYQCCSSGSNPVRIREMIQYVQQEANENYQKHDRLFYRKPRRPFVMVSKKLFHGMMRAMRLPLTAVNQVSRMLGGNLQARTLENIETAMMLSTVFSFYTEPTYIFRNEQLMALSSRMLDVDQKTFPVDAKLIDWKHYMRNIHIPGLNQYALRERKLYKLNAKTGRDNVKAA